MKRETMKNVVGILLFYAILIGGVIAINARMEYLAGQGNITLINK